MGVKMSAKEIKSNRKKIRCFSDYVKNVPNNIVNEKYEIAYERLHFIGSVSMNFVIVVVW